MTNTFLIVVLVLSSMILILLSTLAIRERKYEIGVLRAMGLLTEMLAITGICLILGLVIGMVASQPIAGIMYITKYEPIKILSERN